MTRERLGPDEIDDGNDSGVIRMEQFLSIYRMYTEQRQIDFQSAMWEDMQLVVGQEYIVRHKGERWWWSEDAVSDIMDYLESRRSVGIDWNSGDIEIASAGEVRFSVVE